MSEETKYDDGQWYAVTLGHFIGLLVDAGQDPAVCFRVAKDFEVDADGKFVRKIEMYLLPNGHIAQYAKSCKGIHKTLAALIEAGLVK
jgi:hypothetical protein